MDTLFTDVEWVVDDNVPMVHLYRLDRFFVRDCFLEYYANIIKLWSGNDAAIDGRWEDAKTNVILTGARGSGKSVFMLYFLKRYMQENKGEKILNQGRNILLQDDLHDNASYGIYNPNHEEQ